MARQLPAVYQGEGKRRIRAPHRAESASCKTVIVRNNLRRRRTGTAQKCLHEPGKSLHSGVSFGFCGRLVSTVEILFVGDKLRD